MTYLVLGLIIYAFISVNRTLKSEFRDDVPSSNMFVTYFIFIALVSLFLIFPFAIGSLTLIPVLIIFIFMLLLMAKFFYNKYIKFKVGQVRLDAIILKPVKNIYLFVYLPLLSLYFFRIYNMGTMIIASIITLTVIYSLAYVMNKLFYNAHFLNFIGLLYLVLIITSIFANLFSTSPSFMHDRLDRIVVDGETRSRSLFYDNYFINITSVNDDTDLGEVMDFYIDDNYVYYIVEGELYSNDATLKVYDYVQEKLVFEEAITQYQSKQIIYSDKYESDNEQDGTLYFFLLDGIYTLNNLELTKIYDIPAENRSPFYLSGDLHLFYKADDQASEIYLKHQESSFFKDINNIISGG